MASDAFRRELQQEAKRWQGEGLISDEQFRVLAQRYQFDALDTAARDRFVMTLLGLGSLLVGIGAITFVAANWPVLSQAIKAGLLFGAMVIANGCGWALLTWNSRSDRGQRLGQAALLLGALLLGANLALMVQIVHISSTRYELCVAWALGIVVMAYSFRLAYLGVLALLLLGVGYWSALWDVGWLHQAWAGVWTLHLMPVIALLIFLPLAYRCQSQWLFALTAMAAISSLLVLILDLGRGFPAGLKAITLIMPYACLWAYDDTLWATGRNVFRRKASLQLGLDQSQLDHLFQPIARGLMLFGLSIFYWLLSFQDTGLTSWGASATPLPWQDTWLMSLTLSLFGGWTVVSWIALGWRRGRSWRLDPLSATLLVFLLITAGIVFWTFAMGPIPVLATTVFNVLLALMALGLMREGLGAGTRIPFWWGLVLLTLQILSRVLEYETGLLLKSLVFVLCGVVVILVGLWFERYVRILRVDS